MQPLDGYFAFATTYSESFITATGGGGHTTDAIHTDATVPRSWEWFRLWTEEGSEFYALQTINGHFVTAVDAGGRITDTIHTDATSVAGWELFTPTRVLDEYGDKLIGWGLKTSKGFFLTAVGGGGHNSGDTIHTDATEPNTVPSRSWETFMLWRGSHFGTGSTYGINIWGGNGSDQADLRGWMIPAGGGGQPGPYALQLVFEASYPVELSWTLLKQSDGTYALQTYRGTVLSAIGGGAPGVGDSARIPLSTQSAIRRSSPSRTRATSPFASRQSTARTSRRARASLPASPGSIAPSSSGLSCSTWCPGRTGKTCPLAV